MASGCSFDSDGSDRDWVGNWRTLGILWGIPSGVMVAAAFLDPVPRGIIWISMLLWMGTACLANARRCRRTHCRFTGPFFILMAGLVAGHAFGILPLGTYSWGILGGGTLVGAVVIWWASERVWGAFSNQIRQLP
jgi:hypothetical protein